MRVNGRVSRAGLTALLAAVLLTACSGDGQPEVQPVGGQPQAPVWQADGDSLYLRLSIVGDGGATRADFSGSATAEENAVYDGILCIFEGASEAEATLKSAVAIDQLVNNPGTAGSGASLNIVQRLPLTTYAYSQRLYALALLNTTMTGFSVASGMLYLNGTSLSGKTVAELRAQQVNDVGSTDRHVGLYMSSAPQAGYIMPEVTALYDTEGAARASGATTVTIPVERAAARVRVATTLSSGSAVAGITLNRSSAQARFHTMTWTLNRYNTACYALRNGSTAADNWAEDINYTSAPEHTLDATDFSVYPQQSHSNDALYIAENTTNDGSATDANVTEVIVEVQLKDASNMLIHEGYQFNGANTLYTSADQLVSYFKSGWVVQKGDYPAIQDRPADEVFKYPVITIGDGGTVSVKLTNESFSAAEKVALNTLAGALGSLTKGFRDGKMYYTYKIKHTDDRYAVVRNNAYALTLSSVTAIGRPTP